MYRVRQGELPSFEPATLPHVPIAPGFVRWRAERIPTAGLVLLAGGLVLVLSLWWFVPLGVRPADTVLERSIRP